MGSSRTLCSDQVGAATRPIGELQTTSTSSSSRRPCSATRATPARRTGRPARTAAARTDTGLGPELVRLRDHRPATAGFTRQELVAFLEGRRIATRRFFGGNLTRHPAYQDVRYRVHGDLTNSDIVTDDTFWIGVYPGLTEEMIAYMVDSITEFTGARPAATVH